MIPVNTNENFESSRPRPMLQSLSFFDDREIGSFIAAQSIKKPEEKYEKFKRVKSFFGFFKSRKHH